MGRRDREKKRRAARSALARMKRAELPPMPVIGPTPETPAPVLLMAGGAQEAPRLPSGQFPPGQSGNPETQFAPGQSGNAAGSSKNRRFSAGLARLITERGADGAICRVWLQQVLQGNFRFWAFMLDRIEGPVDYRSLIEAPLPAEDFSVIDPKVVEAMLAAADPENIPVFDDDEPQDERPMPSDPATAERVKPHDVSQADWNRSRRVR